MESCKRRSELGLPDEYLYGKNTRSVTFTDFINKELVWFSNCDNERSIPSMVDGLKPGQRKVCALPRFSHVFPRLSTTFLFFFIYFSPFFEKKQTLLTENDGI